MHRTGFLSLSLLKLELKDDIGESPSRRFPSRNRRTPERMPITEFDLSSELLFFVPFEEELLLERFPDDEVEDWSS